MALINDVRQAIRIKTESLDIEVQDLIDSAKADLVLSGVLESKVDTVTTEEPDILIKRCVTLYCKANFGLDNIDSEKYQNAYESLKIHLLLSQEYTVEVVLIV